MSYFTEILAEAGGSWRARDLDVRDYATLDDLAEVMRTVADDEGEALAVIEHEDAWFGLVRLTGEDEIKVFLSDADAAARSQFAELFEDYLDAPLPAEVDDEDENIAGTIPESDDDAGLDGEEEDESEDEPHLEHGEVPSWAGDADLYADRGVSSEELLDQVGEHTSDPARVVAHIGEAVGFAEQLEAVR